MGRTEAMITPAVLKWCREKAGYTTTVAAKKIGRPEDDIIAWENGRRRPTIAQARNAADVYKRPLAVFYMETPPSGFSVLRDFRRLPDPELRRFSPDTLELFRLTKFRQEWLHDYHATAPADTQSNSLPSHSLNDDPSVVAASIRSALNVTIAAQTRAASRSKELQLWQSAAERIGVYVFKSTADPEEYRGFAMSDPVAPVVVVNAADALVAQLFTLIHELAHLSAGVPGVSNLWSYGWYNTSDEASIEWFCNRVAADCLLPPEIVDTFIHERMFALDDPASVAESVSKKFKVSEETVARRLLEMALISHGTYRALRQEFQERWLRVRKGERDRQKSTPGGPSYYVTTASHFSTSFAKSVISAYAGDRITGRDASTLLNAKVSSFPGIASQIGLKEMVSL